MDQEARENVASLELVETRAASPVIVFNGRKYYRHKRKGYYFTSGGYPGPERVLHRAVWVYHNGPIFEGCEIHHIDGDRSNNDIANLECVSRDNHTAKHGKRVRGHD